MFINVFTESGLHKRSRDRHQLPVHLPGGKEIEDKIPTVNIDTLQRDRRRSVSGVLGGADSHLVRTPRRWVKGRHTFKAGVVFEYSGEDDFDQINVNAIPGGTNNQNGQFAFRNSAHARAPASAWRTWRSACSPTTPSSGSARSRSGASLATDIFIQDSWRPTRRT